MSLDRLFETSGKLSEDITNLSPKQAVELANEISEQSKDSESISRYSKSANRLGDQEKTVVEPANYSYILQVA